MVHVRDRKTGRLFDPWAYLGPKRRKLLEESWAGLFRRDSLPELPVETIASHFHDSFGRPTKEVYTTLGTLLFQQMFDLTDAETVEQLAFNLQWHYALDLPGESDAAKYLCLKTLWSIRKSMAERNLDAVLFAQVTSRLAALFSVDPKNQRIDSVHIASNMRRLGRIGIFVRVITRFLVNLRRHHKERFASLEASFSEKYLTKQEQAAFAMVKPSESAKTLTQVGADMYLLVRRFVVVPAVTEMKSYKLLCRVIEEQCAVDPDGDPAKVSLKPPREIPSHSVQNPSDPDAGYSGHKGQGYQAQIMETYHSSDSSGEEKDADKGLQLITYVSVEPAHKSDAGALLPALSSSAERGLAPREVLADSPYGSDDNVVAAAERGVAVVSPLQGPKMDKTMTLAVFSLSLEEEILRCPHGATPIKKARRKKSGHVVFSADACLRCPLRPRCPVRPGKGGYWLRFDDKALRIARRRAHERSPAFVDRYRFRAGIEGTFSALDRRTGVKRLRVRGMKAVRYCVTLKGLGLNIFRAAAFRGRKTGGNPAPAGAPSPPAGAIGSLLRHLVIWIRDLAYHLALIVPEPVPVFPRTG
jgi:hypothetical protein